MTTLTRVGEGMAFKKHWGADFRLSQIDSIVEDSKSWEEKHGSFKINPNDLNSKELDELGFGTWSDENPIRLIPIWLVPFLTENLETISISGSKHSKLEELDFDTRFGCIAYGVLPSS